jgi:hypothetical protein
MDDDIVNLDETLENCKKEGKKLGDLEGSCQIIENSYQNLEISQQNHENSQKNLEISENLEISQQNLENSQEKIEISHECLENSEESVEISLKKKEILIQLSEIGKKVNAKTFAGVKFMAKAGNQLESLAFSLLEYFQQEVPRSFLWEPICKLFSNPGPLISKIRNAEEEIKNKKISENVVKVIWKKINEVDRNQVGSFKSAKDLNVFIEFLVKFCEVYLEFWPETLIETAQPKKKFKIPMSQKNIEEHELIKKINQEKRLLQELKYQERKLKWEEDRQIKKELKQEQFRDQQREIIYTKNIEEDFKKKQNEKKKQRKTINT